jgi:histidyl-tRNA synthetase
MSESTTERPTPRIPRGFRDVFSADLNARRRMIALIRQVYEIHGFEPLETPAVEYVETLGKYLPESDTPEGGVFAMRDDDEAWLSLRYDLTAPLSRLVAQMGAEIPSPFRRYQVGPVWRKEKPGPGRYREFTQCDIDTVGAPTMAADAEVCIVLARALDALCIAREDYRIRVNNRKILNGVLDRAQLPAEDTAQGAHQRLTVLRAIDKLDRLGIDAVKLLLGPGRKDESGDFTPGAGLSEAQAEPVIAFVETVGADRLDVCAKLRELVGDSVTGQEGVAELEAIHELLDAAGLDSNVVAFDPSVVRGLAYYTGPVFEAELTFEIVDEEGKKRPFGSVAGGGRYDDLVERFTGTKIPATGASIGVDRLLAALRASKWREERPAPGPIVVTIFEQDKLAEYQKMTDELRAAGLRAEMYLGKGGFRKQLKYADKRNAPIAVIVGGDELARGEVTLKDMWLGKELSGSITDRDEWRKGQPAQLAVPRAELVAKAKEILARYDDVL